MLTCAGDGNHETPGDPQAGLRTLAQWQQESGGLFSLLTPLCNLTPDQPQYSKAIAVGPSSPQVPEKLAKKAWQGEDVDLQDLLPADSVLPLPRYLMPLQLSRKSSTRSLLRLLRTGHFHIYRLDGNSEARESAKHAGVQLHHS